MKRTLSVLSLALFAAACASESPIEPLTVTPASILSNTGSVVFDVTPATLPPNIVSQGYQCCQTAELGDRIHLAGTDRHARSATIIMSDWAKHSDYPTMNPAGFSHPITLNIYAVNTSDPYQHGALLGTVTQTFTIPWRPEPDPTCPGYPADDAWKASNGSCYHGFATPITFDLRSLDLTLPDEFIYGIAFNTNTWGYNPIGQPGPYESLNVGLATASPTVGTDVDPDAVFWNTGVAGWYADGGTHGVGIFRLDTGWSPYSPAVRFNAFTVAAGAAACRNGGWQTAMRADASGFANQGDCVSYVQNGK
jgi:hypothetical protein